MDRLFAASAFGGPCARVRVGGGGSTCSPSDGRPEAPPAPATRVGAAPALETPWTSPGAARDGALHPHRWAPPRRHHPRARHGHPAQPPRVHNHLGTATPARSTPRRVGLGERGPEPLRGPAAGVFIALICPGAPHQGGGGGRRGHGGARRGAGGRPCRLRRDRQGGLRRRRGALGGRGRDRAVVFTAVRAPRGGPRSPGARRLLRCRCLPTLAGPDPWRPDPRAGARCSRPRAPLAAPPALAARKAKAPSVPRCRPRRRRRGGGFATPSSRTSTGRARCWCPTPAAGTTSWSRAASTGAGGLGHVPVEHRHHPRQRRLRASASPGRAAPPPSRALELRRSRAAHHRPGRPQPLA